MSSKPRSKMSRSRRQTLAMGFFIIAACIVIGIYAVLDSSGNPFSSPLTAQSEQNSCHIADDERAKLAKLSIGSMQNLQIADANVDMSFLAFKNDADEPMGLADFAGKSVFVNLWATWCAPCRHEMPAINTLAANKTSDRFEVIALSLDKAEVEKSIQFLDEIGADKLPYYGDRTGELFKALAEQKLLQGLPTSYLINSSGCLVATLSGAADWASKESFALMDYLADL